MLRQAIRLSSRRSLQPLVRNYAAAKKGSNPAKRALTQEQLKGTTAAPAAPPKVGAPAAAPPPPPKATVTTTPRPPEGPAAGAMETGGAGGSDPSSGGGEIMLPIAIVLTTLSAAWYFDFIPGMKRERPPPLIPVRRKRPEPFIVDTPLPEAVVDAVVEEKKEEPVIVAEEPAPEASESDFLAPEEVAAATKFLEEALTPEPVFEKVAPVVEEEPVPEPEPEPVLASVEEATRELMASKTSSNDKTLQKAHQALRATVDESLYSDLEQLSPAELRVRVVQLGTEMTERTKWEAVRLKEFLAMKEKEVGEQ
jgi:hypothetical protein